MSVDVGLRRLNVQVSVYTDVIDLHVHAENNIVNILSSDVNVLAKLQSYGHV